jgi:hypothetical protein
MSERRVTKLLDLAVTADSEEEAYAKAHRMLNANAPEPVEPNGGLSLPLKKPEQHLHRASCHGSSGELQCGFPANGPTI